MFQLIFWLLAALIALGLFFLHLRLAKMREFWPNKGFYFLSPAEIGGLITNMFKKVHAYDFDQKCYKILKEKNLPCAGYLEFINPILYLKDLELIKKIYVKDFDHFADRRDLGASPDRFFSKMLFFMEGEAWKDLRSKMSPTFTTGKIRRTFQIVDNCGVRLVKYLQTQTSKNGPTVDFSEGFGKYTIDVIFSAAFGVESGVFDSDTSRFEIEAKKTVFKLDFKTIATLLVTFISPKLGKLLNISIFDSAKLEFLTNVIFQAIQRREETGEKRDDFLQLMIEAKAGQLKPDDEDQLDKFEKDAIITKKISSKVLLTNDVICAQSLLFFFAGYDTTQSVLLFSAYQLAVCQDVQEKLAQEVQASFEENDGKFTYESINAMEYLDKFISETLRMFPPIPRMERKCVADYTIPDTNLKVPAGTMVIIPIYAIQHDPDIFPEPEKFDPERFSKQGKGERNPYTFGAFGHGPRNCIGMRFALFEVKIALAHLVLNFKFEPCHKTLIPMQLAQTTTTKPKDVWVNLSPRNKE